MTLKESNRIVDLKKCDVTDKNGKDTRWDKPEKQTQLASC